MRLIYHLVPRRDWDSQPTGPYHAASLQTEGFIHCSNREQVERVANLFYAEESELLLLCIDVERLPSEVRDEDIGTGERFPHVYGEIDRNSVVGVASMRRDEKNAWILPANIS
jgi:uncharacterized protein (DUF952 family)